MKNKVTLVIFIFLHLLIASLVSSCSSNKEQETYTLISFAQQYNSNTTHTYSFSILDTAGKPIKDFAITHTKRMHIIIVRTDLHYFQHLHPDFDQTTGFFTLHNISFPAPGEYRIFADFAIDQDTPITLHEDIIVGTTYEPQPLGTDERTKIFTPYNVTLKTNAPLLSNEDSLLLFSIQQNTLPVTDLEEYLGARGHSVILSNTSLDFIHAHPLETTQNGDVSFMVTFPYAGTYKIFTQFQHDEKVFTTDFVVSVQEGSTRKSHSMH